MKKFVIQNIKCQYLSTDMNFATLDNDKIMTFTSRKDTEDFIHENQIKDCEVGIVEIDKSGKIRPSMSQEQLNHFINKALTDENIERYVVKIMDATEIDETKISMYMYDETNIYYSTRIKSNDYRKRINSIWWLSYMGSVISNHGFISELLFSSIGFSEGTIKYINSFAKQSQEEFSTSPKNISLYQPVKNIFEELCSLISNKHIYQSYLSLLMRQLIEILILNKEIDIEKIKGERIFNASVASFNKQLGADQRIFKDLNLNNPGLFKVFNNNVRLSKLAKKHSLGFAYSYFSGDIHSYSSIEKLMPYLGSSKSKYNDIYIEMCFSLVVDVCKYLLSKNKQLKSFTLDIPVNISIFDSR